ncbi:MAG: hypothetical protein ABFD08_20545 [Syntrophomonas sp.]
MRNMQCFLWKAGAFLTEKNRCRYNTELDRGVVLMHHDWAEANANLLTGDQVLSGCRIACRPFRCGAVSRA